MSKKTHNKKQKRQLEEIFGEKTVEMIVRGKLIRLVNGRSVKKGRNDSQVLPSIKTTDSNINRPKRKSYGTRPPLPEDIFIRKKHKRNIGVGRDSLPGTQIDIFFSHYENNEQSKHTHTIIYDDECDNPKNLLVYDRGLNRNRFLIAPGRKCKPLKKGEESEIGIFEIPNPENSTINKEKRSTLRITDESSEAKQLSQEIEFDADLEWINWRGREYKFEEFKRDNYREYNRTLESQYEKWRSVESFKLPCPEIDEP